MQFLSNDDRLFTVFAAISALILIVGVAFNIVVLATFIVNRSLFSNTENLFIFCVALSDLLTCTVAVPTSLISNIAKKWVFGDFGCDLHGFLVTWYGLVSITHLAALAFNRHEKINVYQNQIMNEKRVKCILAVLWVFTFIVAIAPVFGWSRYTTEGIGTSCSIHWASSDSRAVSYTVCIFLGGFILPVILISFSYYKLYKTIRIMKGNANATWGSMSIHAQSTSKAELKMAAIILVMIIAFLFSWTPYAVVSIISACGGSQYISPLVASFPAYFAKSSTLYNPVIYFFMYKRFRQKVIELFSRCIFLNEFLNIVLKRNAVLPMQYISSVITAPRRA